MSKYIPRAYTKLDVARPATDPRSLMGMIQRICEEELKIPMTDQLSIEDENRILSVFRTTQKPYLVNFMWDLHVTDLDLITPDEYKNNKTHWIVESFYTSAWIVCCEKGAQCRKRQIEQISLSDDNCPVDMTTAAKKLRGLRTSLESGGTADAEHEGVQGVVGKKYRGKQVGATRWTEDEVCVLLEGIREVEPHGNSGWSDVENYCRVTYDGVWKRSGDSCKHKFEKLYMYKDATVNGVKTIPNGVKDAKLIRSIIESRHSKVRNLYSSPNENITAVLKDAADLNSKMAMRLNQAMNVEIGNTMDRVMDIDLNLKKIDDRITEVQHELVELKHIMLNIKTTVIGNK